MLASYTDQPLSGGLVRGLAEGAETGETLPENQKINGNPIPSTSSEKNPNKRKQYLKILGIKPEVDPFLNPVAEQEIDQAGNISQFFAYYYSPETEKSGALDIDRLRAPQHSFIYGKPGDGKTTLRLILDASCRTRPDQTLVVTYLLDLPHAITIEEHGSRLAQALAVDFLLQLIEQAPGQIQEDAWPDDPARFAALVRQIQCAGDDFMRVLEPILNETTPEGADSSRSRLGLGVYWKQALRYPVQYVAVNEALKGLLERASAQSSQQAVENLPGMAGVWQGLRDAQTWGFRQVFVLVDGVDARLRDEAKMAALVTPVLSELPDATRKGMYFKFFFPLEIKPTIDLWCQKHLPAGLYSTCLNATINWTQSALRQLLIQRFRAAGSQMISSLDELADSQLPDGLEQPVITLANGSPRKLLELISKLIQVHAERDSDQIQIDQVDFEKMKKAV